MPRFEDLFGNPSTEGMSQKDYVNVERTKFVHKSMQYMQGIEGAIMPIDCRKLLPNETVNAKYAVKIKLRNPSIRPLKNGMKFYVHTYVVYNRDLWKNWEKYIGRKAGFNNQDIKYPVMDFWGCKTAASSPNRDNGTTTRGNGTNNVQWTSLTPNSLANCLGIPWEAYTSSIAYLRNDDTEIKKIYSENRYCFRPTITKLPGTGPDFPTGTRNTKLNTDVQFEVSHNLADTKLLVSALPFVAYQKIRRKYYMNYNLYGDNKKGWFEGNGTDDFRIESGLDEQGYTFVNSISMNQQEPNSNDIGDWRHTDTREPIEGSTTSVGLDAIASNAEKGKNPINNPYKGENNSEHWIEVPQGSNEFVSKNICYLNSLGFREVKGDYFTSGSPYPMLMRDGVQPVIEKEVKADLADLLGTTTETINPPFEINDRGLAFGQTEDAKLFNLTQNSQTGTNYYNKLSDDQKAALEKALTDKIGINMHDIRTMATLTKFKERMSKINEMDYYNDIIETSFKINPHAEVHEPFYVGGFNGTIGTFGQQSTNTEFNGETPLGEVGMAEGTIQGDCGTFTAKDHGYMITVISCQIDTLYPRHLNRHFTTIDVENEYFPDFNELEPQATLRKEKSLLCSDWDDPYNYQDRYLEYKTTLSNLCGLGQSKKQKWDNYQYLTMTDEWEKSDFNMTNIVLHPDFINNECLTVTTEPMFDYDVYREVESIAPLPYRAKPMEL